MPYNAEGSNVKHHQVTMAVSAVKVWCVSVCVVQLSLDLCRLISAVPRAWPVHLTFPSDN